MDYADMTFWFPKIAESGIPIPKTLFVTSAGCTYHLMDGKQCYGWDDFVKMTQFAVEQIGYPSFLRGSHTSGKHGWKDCCVIANAQEVESKLAAQIEDAAMKDLPFLNTVAVRKMLDTQTLFTAFFGHMPITKEIRLFVEAKQQPQQIPDNVKNPKSQSDKLDILKFCTFPEYDMEIYHIQPYWPISALENQVHDCDNWQQILTGAYNEISIDELDQCADWAKQAALACSEFHECKCWSVDFLQDANGDWWLIDMAPGGRSYYYPWQEESWTQELINFKTWASDHVVETCIK